MKNKYRSPFFYVGDKYQIIDQIITFFPKAINRFFDPFTGGGTVFLNVKANMYYVNDVDSNVIGIHRMLVSHSKNTENFYRKLLEYLDLNSLSKSFSDDIVPIDLKKKYVKTYYSRYNKESYNKIRGNFNASNRKDYFVLYILLIYGFNRMLRFNLRGEFNLPVGNVDMNKNVIKSLDTYFNFVNQNKIEYSNMDYKDFLQKFKFKSDDFIYFDPPYFITSSEYNKTWNEKSETEFLNFLIYLNEIGVKFMLSNVLKHNGKYNKILMEWIKKNEFTVHFVKSKYISYHNNMNNDTIEVVVLNYE